MGADRAAIANGCARRGAGGRPACHQRHRACAQEWLPLVRLPEAYGPPTTIYNRFVRWARRGIWENLFRELAANGRSADTQMINSTHVKAHRSAAGGKGGAEAGCWPFARRAQHKDSRTRRC